MLEEKVVSSRRRGGGSSSSSSSSAAAAAAAVVVVVVAQLLLLLLLLPLPPPLQPPLMPPLLLILPLHPLLLLAPFTTEPTTINTIVFIAVTVLTSLQLILSSTNKWQKKGCMTLGMTTAMLLSKSKPNSTRQLLSSSTSSSAPQLELQSEVPAC